MKNTLYLLVFAAACASCKKPVVEIPVTPAVQMTYVALGDAKSGYQQPVAVDVNKDGAPDVSFGMLLVGDPQAQQDKYQFFVSGKFNTYFAVDPNEHGPLLNKGAVISLDAFPQYNWYNASWLLIAQKVISIGLPPYWEGQWKSASHQYIPFYLTLNDGDHFGWVEFSFDTNLEKIVLHTAAMAVKPGVAVKAGF